MHKLKEQLPEETVAGSGTISDIPLLSCTSASSQPTDEHLLDSYNAFPLSTSLTKFHFTACFLERRCITDHKSHSENEEYIYLHQT